MTPPQRITMAARSGRGRAALQFGSPEEPDLPEPVDAFDPELAAVLALARAPLPPDPKLTLTAP